jgi:lipopolysaccharide/colanic/teichoic acid biosynthesis glycosyltransferase
MKRLFDFVVATVLAVLTLPIMAAIALLVRFKLGTPVLFRQQRPGRGGRPFTLLKFRTMLDGSDLEGRPLPDDQRLTPFGRWLRSTSLDELPELFNVLGGDMSLVGPRPLLIDYLPLYSERQARRHEVRPGITGWAQVNGRNATTWKDRLEQDVWYVENRTMALDLRILLQTLRMVLTREGISAPGEATMPRYQGTDPGEASES